MELEYSLLLKLEEDVEFVRRLDMLEQIAHLFCPNMGLVSYFICLIEGSHLCKYISQQ